MYQRLALVSLISLLLGLAQSGQAATPVPLQLTNLQTIDPRVLVFPPALSLEVAPLENALTTLTADLLKGAQLSIDHTGYPELNLEVRIRRDLPPGPWVIVTTLQLCEQVYLRRDPSIKIPGDCAVTWQTHRIRIVHDEKDLCNQSRDIAVEALREFLDDLESARNYRVSQIPDSVD